jgi:hypothetical protein
MCQLNGQGTVFVLGNAVTLQEAGAAQSILQCQPRPSLRGLLTAMVCALAAETKESEYLAMIERHKQPKRGQRGADLIAQMFAELVDNMSRANVDTHQAITQARNLRQVAFAPCKELRCTRYYQTPLA